MRIDKTAKVEGHDPTWKPNANCSDIKMISGWVELERGQLHSDKEAVPSVPPFIEGCVDEAAGNFVARDKTIRWEASKK
jgi:hypothetical protein